MRDSPATTTSEQMALPLFPDKYGPHPDDTLERSQAARDEGMEMVNSGHPATMARAKITIVALIAAGLEITADDVADSAPEIYERAPQAVGSAFMALSRQRVIAPVGFDTSRRKRQHAAMLRRWGKGPQWGQR